MIASEPVARPQTIRRPGFWWMLLLSTAAFAAASWASWQRPVWHDELYTLYLARMPVVDLIEALRVDSGPPLHYLLCHLLYLIVGWPEGSQLGTFLVRLPSAVAYALLPWMVWWGTRQLSAAQFWGPLLAVSWLPMLYFATEARAYALLALVNAVVWILGPTWIKRGKRWTIVFAAVAACLPLLHYTGIVSLALLPTSAFFVDRPCRRRLLFSVAAATFPVLLWSPIMLGAPSQSMAWVDTSAGPGRPGLATLGVLAPAGPFPGLFEVAALPLPSWLSLQILGCVAAAAAFGALRYGRETERGQQRSPTVSQLMVALVPAVVLAASALSGVPVYFAGRTESLVWGAAAALTVTLFAALRPLVRRTVLGAYVAVGLATLNLWLADLPSRQPAIGVEVGQRLAPLVEDGDCLVVVGLWQLEVRHGLAQAVLESARESVPLFQVETLPRSQAEHPGWLDRESVVSDDLLIEAQKLEREARQRRHRIWLVWSPTLPVDRTVLPAFKGWQRYRTYAGSVILVDLLVPPGHAAIFDLTGNTGAQAR